MISAWEIASSTNEVRYCQSERMRATSSRR
jgi:hypothetical protein